MKRNHAIDLIKVIAPAIIVMHHYTIGFYPESKGFFSGGPVYFGRLVELFFIISGYLTYKY